MADLQPIEVPDIGDFSDVEVIEVFVSVGDKVSADQSLLSVESDKASMEIPAPRAGTITTLQVAVGDRISAGSVIGVMETAEDAASSETTAPATPRETESHTPASTATGDADQHCQLLVIGAGPGGYSAAFRAADLGVNTVLLERYPTLGGVCLNVGCIPSKALLHVAAVIDETRHLSEAGVRFTAPEVDLDTLRTYKDGVIGKLTGGLAGMAKQRKVQVVQGSGKFANNRTVSVTHADGTTSTIGFDYCIIAAGSESVNLPFLPDDPRIVDSTGALNGNRLAIDAAGLEPDERGFVSVDAQMRTSRPKIFAIGDIVGQPMLAHKAVHEGHVAAEVIAGELQNDDALKAAAFDPMQIPSVAYTDPEVAWAGKTETELKAAGTPYRKGLFPFAASGRAIANNRTEGFTKLLFDEEHGRIIGGGIVGTGAGDYIGEVCLAIEMGADAVDIGKTIHPHPTLGESIGLAAEVAHGSCTDLPQQKR